MSHAIQVPGQRKVFRAAYMGGLFTPNIENFLAAFQKIVESSAVRA